MLTRLYRVISKGASNLSYKPGGTPTHNEALGSHHHQGTFPSHFREHKFPSLGCSLPGMPLPSQTPTVQGHLQKVPKSSASQKDFHPFFFQGVSPSSLHNKRDSCHTQGRESAPRWLTWYLNFIPYMHLKHQLLWTYFQMHQYYNTDYIILCSCSQRQTSCLDLSNSLMKFILAWQ